MSTDLDRQPPGVRNALAEFQRRLLAQWGDALVSLRLFGSRARGEAHADSDVDICVVLEHDSWRVRRDVINVAADVEFEYRVPLSPTVFDRATYEKWRRQERALVMDIEREGISL